MNAPVELEAVLVRYADGPNQLQAALVGLTDAELDLAPGSNSWTIRQIAHHVVDGDDIWKAGIKAALGNHNVIFPLQWYWDVPQDRWAECWQYAEREIAPSLALFQANRGHVVQLVRSIPDAWKRCIRIQWPHQSEEQVDVGRIIEMQADHAADHIQDIR
jgi:hypothetical protein